MTLTPVQQRALTWLALAVAALLLLWLLGPALSPLILALVFAYLLWPMVGLLERRARLPRALATTVTVLFAMAAVTGLALLLVPIVTTVIPQLRTQWPQLLDKFNHVVAPRLQEIGIALDTETVKNSILKSFDGNMEEWGQKLLLSARIGGSWLATIVGFLVLVPVLVFYLLVDAEKVTQGAWNLVPLRSRGHLSAFLGECDAMLRQYLKGQLAVMVAMALIYPIGLMFTGLNLAWPIGVFTGLAVFIPYLGYTTGLVLALMSAAIQFTGWHGVASVAVVYAVGQVLESFVLTPRLVGERIGLSPLAVILALLVFGEVFGFVGVLVCLPVTALMVVALRHAMVAYRGSSFYRT
jgi:predicted PurR-regulated permease PerM